MPTLKALVLKAEFVKIVFLFIIIYCAYYVLSECAEKKSELKRLLGMQSLEILYYQKEQHNYDSVCCTAFSVFITIDGSL
jgi:hypothetical protein